jgi:hypothetical protein
MELLQRRKFCREFLNGYNEKLHPQIISRVFEIGLLTLKNTFNKLLFSKEELDEIIKSLSGKEYVDVVPLPPKKKLEKLENRALKEKLSAEENKCSLTQEEIERNKNIKNQHLHRHYLQNPNFSNQNNEIYPFWWWNNKEEDIYPMNQNTINNNINAISDENNYDNDYNDDNYINDMECPRQEINNEEMGNRIKNYSMKKLNNNSFMQKQKESQKKVKSNNICNKNDKLKNKQRLQSSRITQRNNNINNPKFKKINNNVKIPNQSRKNLNLQKIPKFKYAYNKGRILKIEENNDIDMDIMNLTEPNNNY